MKGREEFSPTEAFERNRGLISLAEQERLSSCLVAIAGCGGVGGLHAHTLARLGVGRFRLSDDDTFSLANFNRQIGATVRTLGSNKAAVTADMIRSINPEAHIEIVAEVGRSYPEIALEEYIVDDMAHRLVLRPHDFDVVLLPNLYGDVLKKAGYPVTVEPAAGTRAIVVPAIKSGQNPPDTLNLPVRTTTLPASSPIPLILLIIGISGALIVLGALGFAYYQHYQQRNATTPDEDDTGPLNTISLKQYRQQVEKSIAYVKQKLQTLPLFHRRGSDDNDDDSDWDQL